MTTINAILQDGSNVDMPALRAYLADLEAALAQANSIIATGTVAALVGDRVYATRSALYADLVPADNLFALVYNDTDPLKNGLYQKDGATTAGDWDGPFDLFASAAEGLVQPLVDAAETARDEAEAARDVAVTAVGSIATARDNDQLTIARGALNFATNTGAVLTANGDYSYSNGFSVRWDYMLSPSEIAAGEVYVLLQGSAAFAGASIEQRSASASLVATADISEVGIARYQKITLNAGTVMLRVAASRGSGTSGTFRPLAVGIGEAARALTDPALAAQNVRAMLADDGADLAATPHVIEVFGFGTLGTINASGTVTVPASSQNRIRIAPVSGTGIADGDDWFVALELLSGNGAFAAFAAPIAPDGTVGTEIAFTKRQGQFFLTDPQPLDNGGDPIDQVRIRIDTQNVAEGVSSGAQTFRARLYQGNSLPGFDRVPALIADDITEQLADPASYGTVVVDGALSGGGDPATGIDVRLDPTDYLLHQAMDARIMLLTSTALHAVNTDGSNGAAGGLETPWATVAHAIANTSNGDIIGLRNGQRHLVGAVGFGSSNLFDRSIVGYGPAATRAIVDARQTVSSGWSATSGRTGIYQVDVVHRENTVTSGGSPSGKSAFALWDENDQSIDWIVMNSTLSDNLDQMQADEAGFTVVRTGTINKDPRLDSATTTYTYYYRPADGLIPNGKSIRIADRELVLAITGENEVRDVELIGAIGKDFAQVRVDGLVGNYIARHCNQHGIVAQASHVGEYKAYGRPVPGGVGFDEGRADGGGFNAFTPTDYPTIDREYGHIHAENFISLFYAHGAQGGQYYRNMTVARVTGRNGSNAVSIDNRAGGNEELALAGTLTVSEIDVSEIGTLCNTACNTVIGTAGRRSSAVFSELTADTNQLLAYFKAAGQVVEMIDIDIDFLKPLGGSSKNYVGRRLLSSGYVGADVPTLILSGVRYVGNMTNRPLMWFAADVNNRYHLVLKRGTQWVDMHEEAGADFYPASLTVEAGCRFGFGGRTREQIRDWLDSHSITHSIDDDTTIIGPRGNVIDWPA